jgi:thermitase
MIVVKTDRIQDLQTQINEIESDPTVQYAEPNYIYYIQSNDTDYSRLWALPTISWPSAISVITNPIIPTTGTIVAVIDVGVDYTHPDLINNMRD